MQPHRPTSAQQTAGRRHNTAAAAITPSANNISHYRIKARLSDREEILAALHHSNKGSANPLRAENHQSKIALAKLRHGGAQEINQFSLVTATSSETFHCRDVHESRQNQSLVGESEGQVTPIRDDDQKPESSSARDTVIVEYRFRQEENVTVQAWSNSKEKIENSEMTAAELLEKKAKGKQKQPSKTFFSSSSLQQGDRQEEFVSSLAAYVAEIVAIEQLASEQQDADKTVLLNPIQELLIHPPSRKLYVVRKWPNRTLQQYITELSHDTILDDQRKGEIRVALVRAVVSMVANYHSRLGLCLGAIHPDLLMVNEISREGSVPIFSIVPMSLAYVNWFDDLNEVDFSQFLVHSSKGESCAAAAVLPPRPSQLNRFEAGCNEATARADRRRYDWAEYLSDTYPGLCPPEVLPEGDGGGLGLQTSGYVSIDSWQLGRLCRYIMMGGRMTLEELTTTYPTTKGTSQGGSSDVLVDDMILELTQEDSFSRLTPVGAAKRLGLVSDGDLELLVAETGFSLRIESHIEWLQKQIVKTLLSEGTTFVSLSTKFVANSLAANSVDQSKVIEAATKELFKMECQSHFTRGVTPSSEGETYKPSPRRIGSAERRLDAVERPSPSPFSPSRAIQIPLTHHDSSSTGKPPRPFSAHSTGAHRGTFASSTLAALQSGSRGRPTSAAVGRLGETPLKKCGEQAGQLAPYLSVTIQNIQCLKVPVPDLLSMNNQQHSFTTVLDTTIDLIPACLAVLRQSSFLRVDLSFFRPLPQSQQQAQESEEVAQPMPQLKSGEEEEEEGFTIKSEIPNTHSSVGRLSALGVTVSVLGSARSAEEEGSCSSTGRLKLQPDPTLLPSFQPDGKLSLMVSVPQPSTGQQGGQEDYQAIKLKLNTL